MGFNAKKNNFSLWKWKYISAVYCLPQSHIFYLWFVIFLNICVYLLFIFYAPIQIKYLEYFWGVLIGFKFEHIILYYSLVNRLLYEWINFFLLVLNKCVYLFNIVQPIHNIIVLTILSYYFKKIMSAAYLMNKLSIKNTVVK